MNIQQKIAEILNRLQKEVPLVHNITNYVTVNDCANAVLAIGASPIMADDSEEAADITAVSSSLVLNIGTLNQRTVASMIQSGKKANELGIPVIFDPVGAGASRFRNETARNILDEVDITILRGNLSEVSFLAGFEAAVKGVDSSAQDERNDSVKAAVTAAKRLGCTVALTGVVDVITDGNRVVKIYNGHPMLSKVTGTGCMTTALTGAFAAAADDYVAAAAGSVACMGIAGELAYERAGMIGTGSFHIAIIDAISNMNGQLISEKAKLEENG